MANILTGPRYWKNKALLAKIETTVGTDATPTGAANWIEARNLSITPLESETADRNIEMPWMGSAGKVSVGQYVKASFEVALAGSGAAGTAPKFAPLLLACGMSETLTASTSAAYSLISTAFPAVSMYVNVDGTLHKLIGSRGTVSPSLAKGGIPVLKFEFEAVYTDAAAQTMPTITRTGWPTEEPVNAANTTAVTINGVALAFSALDISLGNKLTRVNLPGPQIEVAITDRAPSGSVTVLAPALATFDPFALVKSVNVVTLTVTHGTAAGKKAKLDAKIDVTGCDYDNIDGMAAYKLTYEPTPVSGNDEFALTFL
ncbi:MAG: hypothetical protein HGA47_06870 [Zoogloea sp.]|nr:hypothetical protein [Zoogloea sp.]